MKAAGIPLSVAFEVATGIAFAQSASDPMVNLRACSLMERVERLACLDRLSRDIAPDWHGTGWPQLDYQRDHFTC